jgi:hypothetical protein
MVGDSFAGPRGATVTPTILFASTRQNVVPGVVAALDSIALLLAHD